MFSDLDKAFLSGREDDCLLLRNMEIVYGFMTAFFLDVTICSAVIF